MLVIGFIDSMTYFAAVINHIAPSTRCELQGSMSLNSLHFSIFLDGSKAIITAVLRHIFPIFDL